MPLFVYLVIAAVAVFSVGLEWDALVAPSKTTWHEMQAVSDLGKAPEQHLAAKQSDTPRIAAPANPQTAAGNRGSGKQAAPVKTGEGEDAQAAADDTQAQKVAPPAQCNVAACSAAYVSFRAADCTYQPFEGPRRLCTRGSAANAAPAAVADADTPAVTRCHYRTCAERYSSFDPSDCTYQPLEGPRRICEK